MTGMNLAEKYFNECGREIFQREFPELFALMTFGLAGEGSECFGFDDEFSRDHDFGADFCIFVPEEIFREHGSMMQKIYDEMPDLSGEIRKCSSQLANGRRGVISSERFYMKYTGCPGAPVDNLQWLKIPQSHLASAVNGKIFLDGSSSFSETRRKLMEYYPDDVKRKKLAAQTFFMGQAGQYNCIRMMKRGDFCAAFLAKAEFIKAALATIFILNDEYMPFYKWSFRAAEKLPRMKRTFSLIKELAMLELCSDNFAAAEALIEDICSDTLSELNIHAYSLSSSRFLCDHGIEIMCGIKDSRIRSLDVTLDF